MRQPVFAAAPGGARWAQWQAGGQRRPGRIMAQGPGSVTDMVIKGIFPWCFTPEPSCSAIPDELRTAAERHPQGAHARS
jgi:hypothetical protein